MKTPEGGKEKKRKENKNCTWLINVWNINEAVHSE
jgi:hypothetical protein